MGGEVGVGGETLCHRFISDCQAKEGQAKQVREKCACASMHQCGLGEGGGGVPSLCSPCVMCAGNLLATCMACIVQAGGRTDGA
jgi:hypothetical protein